MLIYIAMRRRPNIFWGTGYFLAEKIGFVKDAIFDTKTVISAMNFKFHVETCLSL